MVIDNKSLAWLIWLVTRAPVAAVALIVAGVWSSIAGTFPLFLNDLLLWSLRIYPSFTEGGLRPPPSSLVVFDHPTFFDHAVLMQWFGRTLRFVAKSKMLGIWPLSAISAFDILRILPKKSLICIRLDAFSL